MEALGYSTMEVRVRAVRAALAGESVGRVARAHGVTCMTLFRWLERYREAAGEQGLQRRPVSGRPRKLQCMSEYNFKRMVLAPATRFGFEADLWTVGRLHAVLVDRFNEEVSEDTVWRRLREAGLTWQAPEREYGLPQKFCNIAAVQFSRISRALLVFSTFAYVAELLR